MGAGDGAAEQSRLAAERIERLKRQINQAERSAGTWSAGAEGERMVAQRLSHLIPLGWMLLHDVHWPGRKLANLDHVLVGPGGVVVVDTKNWSGRVDIKDGMLRQNGRWRHHSVESALEQASAIAALLAAPHRQVVRAVICMAGQPDFSGVTAAGVPVVGVDSIIATVAALPPVIDQQTVLGLYSHLGRELTQPQDLAETHGRAGRHPSASPRGVSSRGVRSSGAPSSTSMRPALTSKAKAKRDRNVRQRLLSLLFLGIAVATLLFMSTLLYVGR